MDTTRRNRQWKDNDEGRVVGLHPWRRFLARILDYWLFTILFSAAVFFIDSPALNYLILSFGIPGFLVLAGIITITMEVVLLRFFGTTFGKSLFGIRIILRDGGRPSVKSLSLRSVLVWAFGCACYFPVVEFVAWYISFTKLAADLETDWDKKAGTLPVFADYNKFLAFLAFLVLFIVGLGLNFYPEAGAAAPETTITSNTDWEN